MLYFPFQNGKYLFKHNFPFQNTGFSFKNYKTFMPHIHILWDIYDSKVKIKDKVNNRGKQRITTKTNQNAQLLILNQSL